MFARYELRRDTPRDACQQFQAGVNLESYTLSTEYDWEKTYFSWNAIMDKA